MSKNTDTFDSICGNCAGIDISEITADDVRAQAAINGCSDAEIEAAILGLYEYYAEAGLVNVADVNSIGISGAAKAAGCEYIELIGTFDHPDHPGSNDWHIRLYAFNGIRVAETNGDPVWEEDDPQVFADLMEEYGVDNA